jgi:MFS family permease
MPVLLTIFGFKTTPRVMLIGMAAGTIVTAVILIYYKHIDAFFPGIFANLAFLLGSHYLLKEKRRLASRVLTEQRLMGGVSTWEKQTKELHKFKLLPYIKEHLPSQQYFYPLLALYLISSSYFALYCVPYHMQAHYAGMYRFTQFSILYIVPSLILFFMWPIRLRETRFLAWLLPSVLLYAFFFLGAIIVFMSGFAPMPMAMFMMHLLMTMTVTSWPLVVSLATIGITLAVLLFNYCFGEIILVHTFSIPFIIGYSCFVLSSALIVVRRFNESHRMRKRKEKHAQADLFSTIQDVLQYLTVEERFNTAWQVKDMQALEKAATVTHQLSNKIVELEQRITSSQVHDEDLLATKAKLEKAAQALSLLVDKPTAYTKPHFEKLSVKKMIQQTAMQLYFDDIVEEPNITLRLERNMEHQTVNVDIAKMKDLFHHALFYTLHALSDQRRKIIVSVAGSELTYPLRSGEAQQRVSAVCITITTLDTLPELLPAYESNIEDALWDVPLTFTTLPLFSAKQILKGSHSYMAIDRTGHDAITQVYVIPQDVCEGRPQAMADDVENKESKPT